LEAMQQAVNEMRHQGVQPNVVTFNTMLNAYASHNQPGWMEETAALMQSTGIEMSTVSYNTLMKGWIRAGRTDKVKEVFNRMHKSTQARPNVEAWSIYVDALGKAGELEAMQQAVNEMRQQGVQPNVFTFNAMLNGYASHNQPEQMEETAALMQSTGIKMNRASYSTLLKGWRLVGRTDKVKEVFKQMHEPTHWPKC